MKEYRTLSPEELWQAYRHYQDTGTYPKPEPETVGEWTKN